MTSERIESSSIIKKGAKHSKVAISQHISSKETPAACLTVVDALGLTF
jgi:hypothetical protein